MWIALRPFRYRNVTYQVGDTVPAENWSNRRAFFVTRRIREVPSPTAPPVDALVDVPAATETPDPAKMKRAELNDYALSIGVDKPEGYTNRDTLLAAVELVLHPSPTPVSDSTVDSTKKDAVEEEDPFADLEEETKKTDGEDGS